MQILRPLNRRSRGFTLIELVVVVAVIAIAAGFVAPNFGRVVAQHRLVAGSNDLLGIMHSGRLEALRTRTNVVVCASQNGSSCGGSNWKTAIMFVDLDRNNQVGGSETVKRLVEIASPNVVASNSMAGSAVVVFQPNGLARFASGAITNTNVASLCAIGLDGPTRNVQVGTSMAQTKVVKSSGDRQGGCG